jgi:hypothetical protein
MKTIPSITITSPESGYTIYSMTGTTVQRGGLNVGDNHVVISSLSEGIYLIEIVQKGQRTVK